jgi:hypothetical protein
MEISIFIRVISHSSRQQAYIILKKYIFKCHMFSILNCTIQTCSLSTSLGSKLNSLHIYDQENHSR